MFNLLSHEALGSTVPQGAGVPWLWPSSVSHCRPLPMSPTALIPTQPSFPGFSCLSLHPEDHFSDSPCALPCSQTI